MCGRLADSNYFYTDESILCTNFCEHVMLFACTLHVQFVNKHAICEDLMIPKIHKGSRVPTMTYIWFYLPSFGIGSLVNPIMVNIIVKM